ncbi:MAG TPA: hypothetical protein VGE41_01595 [Verrucomicrobiae bacterium]|jgi:1,6-anhydro-N-acetylmuramate kinase
MKIKRALGIMSGSCLDGVDDAHAAFVRLDYLRPRGRPTNIPGTTGAGRAVLLGQITEQ